jgi:RNA polymerase sigma-70 factor (ECF subfamily)
MISENGKNIFYTIYNKHYKRMLYTATQILGKEGGEEAVHDVFVKLIEKFKESSEILSDKPGQYFVIVVKNHSLNLLKKSKFNNISFEDEVFESDILNNTVWNPEDILLNNEAIEQLAINIRQLSPAMRQVLELRFVEGYTNKEIADQLKITESAVSTAIYKARKRLKEILESEVVPNEAN